MTHCIKSVPIVLDKKLPILLRPEVRNRVCYPQLEERVWETGKGSHTTYWCRKSPQLAPWRIRFKKCRSPLSGTKICAGQFIWTSLKIICQQRGSETYRRHHARRSLRSGYVLIPLIELLQTPNVIQNWNEDDGSAAGDLMILRVTIIDNLDQSITQKLSAAMWILPSVDSQKWKLSGMCQLDNRRLKKFNGRWF